MTILELEPKKIPEIPEKRILKIAIDLDDTFFDDAECVARAVRLGLGRKDPKLRNFSRKDFINYFLENVPAIRENPNGIAFAKEIFLRDFIYRFCRPFPRAVDIVSEWKDFGHQLSFPTARPLCLSKITQDEFEKIKLPWAFGKTVFNVSQYHRALYKAEYTKNEGINVLIDDHAETARTAGSPNTLVLVLSLPYNKNEYVGDYAIVVEAWEDIEYEVNRLSQQPPGFLITKDYVAHR